MKGQNAIFEEILIFALGVVLASSVMLVFNMTSNYVGYTLVHDQLMNVNSLISSIIVDDYMCGENTTLTVRIPQTIGKYEYMVVAKDKKLSTYIFHGNNSFSDTLYGINKFEKFTSFHNIMKISYESS